MTFYPYTRLLVGKKKTIATAGPHIQILDNSTGDTLHSTLTEPAISDAVIKSGPVRCAAVDSEFRYLLTVGEDKMLKVWEVEGLKLLSQRELPKKPSSVAFTADAQTLLVSDKFGDVFSYPFAYNPPPPTPKTSENKKERDSLVSHDNPSGGTLVLGHASPLNAFLLTPDERYIITADRDEHIRVSRYPRGYVIERYCLGHLKFVSAVHIPKGDEASLVSGGGDPVLKVWDWMEGKVKWEVEVWEAVEKYLVVKAVKRRRAWWDGEEDGGGGGGGTGGGKSGRAKRRRRAREERERAQQKKGEKEEEGDEDADGEGEAEDVENGEDEEEAGKEPLKPEKVLVIHRIESVSSDSGVYIVFSAVASTALFAFPHTQDAGSRGIQHFDFGRPVLDFFIADDCDIVVNLDGQWSNPENPAESTSETPSASTSTCPMVKVVKLSAGKLSERTEDKRALVESLNSRSLLSATSEDLKKLDLYSDLTSMPKYSADPEPSTSSSTLVAGSSTPIPIGAPELSSSSMTKKQRQRAQKKAKKSKEGEDGELELTKRELGRLKVNKAVLEKAKAHQAKAEGSSRSQSEVGGKQGEVRKRGEEEEDEEEPEMKRARHDAELVGEDTMDET